MMKRSLILISLLVALSTITGCATMNWKPGDKVPDLWVSQAEHSFVTGTDNFGRPYPATSIEARDIKRLQGMTAAQIKALPPVNDEGTQALIDAAYDVKFSLEAREAAREADRAYAETCLNDSDSGAELYDCLSH